MDPTTGRSRLTRFEIWILALMSICLCWPSAAAIADGSLEPRRPARSSDYPPRAVDQPAERIVVKFQEGTRLRLRDGLLTVEERGGREVRRAEVIGLDLDQISHDANEVRRIALEATAGVGLRRLFQHDEKVLDIRKLAAERRSGRELADLNLYYTIELPDATTRGDVAGLLTALNARPSVEVAYVPGIARNAGFFADRSTRGSTPDFRPLQGYRLPAPVGIDADYAWTIAGGRGPGIKIMDVETRLGEPLFPILHEDLPPISPFEGVAASGNADRDYCDEQHARAVLGELVGKDNGFGVAGLVPDASAGFESFRGSDYPGGLDISAGLMNAADDLLAGDVLLIELELPGPGPNGPCTPCPGIACGSTAVEYDIANFDAIAMITAEGKIVVEPAGNGRHSLDDSVYGDIFDRRVRDSGAIFVAASDPGQGPGVAACFTNFGSRIDAHSWGYDVVTTGYGDLYGCVDDPPDCGASPAENCLGGLPASQRYTDTFSGTSSASPIVAGAAVSLLGAAQANLGLTLTPEAVRDLLVTTGTPPLAGTEIGPQPDLRAALDQLLSPNLPPEPAADFLATREDTPVLFTSQELLANDTDPEGGPVLWCGAGDITQPPNGLVELIEVNPLGLTYRYTPDTGFMGRDAFTYCVKDDQGASANETVTVTVYETVFSDDFESADLSAWGGTVVAGGGVISASDKAAILGSYGLRADIASVGDRAYVIDSTPSREPVYRADFLMAISEIQMQDGNSHTIFTARDTIASQTVIAIRMRRAAGEIEVAAITSRDDGSWAWTSWAKVDKQSRIAVEWRATGFVGGELRFIVDGHLIGTLGGLDNDQLRIDQALFGAVFGIDSGTTGSLLFDQFESGRF